jgi:hypothetical protein
MRELVTEVTVPIARIVGIGKIGKIGGALIRLRLTHWPKPGPGADNVLGAFLIEKPPA